MTASIDVAGGCITRPKLFKHLLTILAMMTGLFCLAPGVVLAGDGAQQCSNPEASQQALRDSFACNMNLRHAEKTPVLMVAGTTLTPDANFSWNYIPALTAAGYPVCTVTVPEGSLVDIQVAAQHIAYGIRRAYSESQGRKVSLIGFSQGGMSPRWALRFFPDTRQKVEDLIGLSASNHGAIVARSFCETNTFPDPSGVLGCEPAFWQQATDSAFITRLNEDFETVPEVDYTSIYTTFDDVLPSNQGPNPTSALLDEGSNITNIALQDLCPLNAANHTAIGTFDNVGWTIALDALENDGPADLDRLLDGNVPGGSPACAELFMPGINPGTFIDDITAYGNSSFLATVNGTHTLEEPPLACSTRRQSR